jgi:hypothetical protein
MFRGCPAPLTPVEKMPTPLTLTTELTREGLLAVRDEIDALLAQVPALAAVPVPAAPQSSLDPLAIELKSHLSAATRNLVQFLVDNYVGQSFTWDDVAAAMKVDVGSVKSWHRSVSKPLNRIGKRNPSAPWLLTGSWDGTRNHYLLDTAWAEAIKGTW